MLWFQEPARRPSTGLIPTRGASRAVVVMVPALLLGLALPAAAARYRSRTIQTPATRAQSSAFRQGKQFKGKRPGKHRKRMGPDGPMNRARRRLMRVPRLRGTKEWNKVHYALGDKANRIEFSWELEGSSQQIVEFYRLSSFSEADWRDLNVDERWAEVGGVSEGLKTGFKMLERMSDAPEFLSDNVEAEVVHGIWEIKSRSYSKRPGHVFEQARWLQQRVTAGDGRSGFHYHVSFRRKQLRKHYDGILTFLAQANEYTYLRMFATDLMGIHSAYLSPQAKETHAWIRAQLKAGKDTDFDEDFDEERDAVDFSDRSRYSSVALRSYPYGEKRVGFEFRSISRDVDSAERMVDNATRFLKSPKQARLKFGTRGGTYRIRDVAHVDRLSIKTPRRFKPEVRAYLVALEEHLRSWGQHPGFGEDLVVRWSVPLVRWEERSYLPRSVKQTIGAARERFIASMDRIVADYSARGPDAEVTFPRRAQVEVEHAVRTFVAEAEFYEYF